MIDALFVINLMIATIVTTNCSTITPSSIAPTGPGPAGQWARCRGFGCNKIFMFKGS